MYAARTRNGFTPASRAELFRKIKPLEIKECPFANLPEKRAGRWGAGLTAAKMAECRWLNPQLVGQFEFVEWTQDRRLWHSRFVALREDTKAADVRREQQKRQDRLVALIPLSSPPMSPKERSRLQNGTSQFADASGPNPASHRSAHTARVRSATIDPPEEVCRGLYAFLYAMWLGHAGHP